MYSIKHKKTGKFFGGFDVNHNTNWVDQECAVVLPLLHAKTQAILLSRFDGSVQRTPVKVD